ncbi:ribonuclease P protein component [Christiangramia sabulilitoris]|uniref:Ribonuclease P protein component n=1 Tax=Christiangramia sabulilitoris TaxID=2583991 RepID=A0A550I8U2_9FLAO|nr:ribonuclease P protein component [Christiangramia sabulilitoris]TRO67393.1 ribonuclease P protein component [Christiangramia sabulilitoris]
MNQEFGKQERLKSKKLIDSLFIEGKSIKSFPLKLVYTSIEEVEGRVLKTGVSVPKKLIKTAVKRNRIKRLMREVFRKNKYLVTSDLSSSHAFMFIYISREEMPYDKLEASMIKLLKNFSHKN